MHHIVDITGQRQQTITIFKSLRCSVVSSLLRCIVFLRKNLSWIFFLQLLKLSVVNQLHFVLGGPVSRRIHDLDVHGRGAQNSVPRGPKLLPLSSAICYEKRMRETGELRSHRSIKRVWCREWTAMLRWAGRGRGASSAPFCVLKVPKREIFDRSNFPDFYAIKSSWVCDLVVKISTYYFNFWGS